MISNPKFYVVLLNHNNYDYTKDCINSLRSCSYPNVNILVVDDFSTDRDIDSLLDDFSDIEFVQNAENLHYCKSFNVGIRHALSHGADYIFLVNNDTKDFSVDYFEVILSEFLRDPSVGMVGSKCIDYTGGVRRDDKPSIRFGLTMDTPMEGYVIKAAVFEKIGGLNEYLIIYMEDLDFILRMREVGYSTKINTSISFAHMGGVATSKRPFYSTYLRTRNVVFFARKVAVHDKRSSLWMLNQVRSNISTTMLVSLQSLLKGDLLRFSNLTRGVVKGLHEGFTTPYPVVWSDKNVSL